MAILVRALLSSVAASALAVTGSVSDGLASPLAIPKSPAAAPERPAVPPAAAAHSQGVQAQPTTPTADFVAELISVKADGTVPGRASWRASASADGRYVAFLSRAHGLDTAAGPPHGEAHVYLRDRLSNTTTAVDVRPDGRFGQGSASRSDYPQYDPVVSADGRLVAFASNSRKLAPGGGWSTYDVFVRDMAAGETTLVSQTGQGEAANADCNDFDLSADGSTVIFGSRATNILPGREYRKAQLYRRDLATGDLTLVSKAPTGEFSRGWSANPALSAEGTRIAYSTLGGSVVPDTNPYAHVVVFYDSETDTAVLVSKERSGGNRGSGDYPDISADGTTVTYTSNSDDLVPHDKNHAKDVFAYDVAAGKQSLVSATVDGAPTAADSSHSSTSSDGTLITYALLAPDDSPRRKQVSDIYRYDAASGDTVLVSRDGSGGPGSGASENPSISADGSLIVFESTAKDLVPGIRGHTLRIYASVSMEVPE